MAMIEDQNTAKEILIKAMESGYVQKFSAAHSKDAQKENLKSITNAYKEIYKVVSDPFANAED